MSQYRCSLALSVAFFIFGLFLPVSATPPAGWPAPANLGIGSSPTFRNSPDGDLTLTFERDEQLFQSHFEASGSWSTPVLSATATSAAGFRATDPDGVSFLACTKEDGSICVSPPSETVVAGPGKIRSDILHFSIDGSGTKHLLYARTQEYDTGSDYSGSDVFYRKQVGNVWADEIPVASGLSISRTFQLPGISVTSQGRVHLCSYRDIYHGAGEGQFTRERCPIQDFSMPARIAADANDTLHFVYQSFAEDAPYDQDRLKYVSKGPAGWGQPEVVGIQYAERIPDLTITPAGELFIAWEDPDGNILVTHRLP
ncbi:MAG TPA: hypothetical protein VIV61_04630 [Candidatus Ozemobacteraceae bacterium]